jgi:predicted nuclease of predicted toxin-antitoxin system
VSRLLLDANVSPSLAEALRWRGHDAVHVNEVDLRTASDGVIFRHAAASRRAVVTHDDDYLRLLHGGAGGPSVIHLSQRELQRDPLVGRLAQAMRLGEVLHELGDRLHDGVAVRVGERAVRIDPLPLQHSRRRDPPGGTAVRAPSAPRGEPPAPGRAADRRDVGRERTRDLHRGGPGERGR